MTYLRIWLTALAILFTASFAYAVPGAGTIMISKKKQENQMYVYSVLIADHTGSSRGFASLGSMIYGNEDPRDAAARETHEEPRELYAKREIRNHIAKAQPIKLGDFTVYVIHVRQIPAKEFEIASTDCEDCDERKANTWIPVSLLDKIIKKKGYQIPEMFLTANAGTDYLWDPFVRTYKAAIPQIRKIIANDKKKIETK